MTTRQVGRPTHGGAFALTELVAVMVIIGILAALAIPRFASAAARQQVEAAARRVTADLRLARRLAKASSVPHRLNFDTQRNRYRIEQRESDKTWTPIAAADKSADSHAVDLEAAPYETELDSVTSNGLLEFDAFGVPQKGIRLVLHAGSRWVTLTFDAETGEVVTSEVNRKIAGAEATIKGGVDDGSKIK